jgi:hypothetical protein
VQWSAGVSTHVAALAGRFSRQSDPGSIFLLPMRRWFKVEKFISSPNVDSLAAEEFFNRKAKNKAI